MEETILVLKLITEGRVRPCARLVIALILEAEPVLISVITEEAISEHESDWIAAALCLIVKIETPCVVVIGLEAMLPAREVERELQVPEEIVLTRAGVRIFRQLGFSGEIPKTGRSGAAIEVPRTETKRGAGRKLHADVAA